MGTDEKLDNYFSRLKNVYEDPKHPTMNLKIIECYLDDFEESGASEETIKTNCSALIFFSKWCIKCINELDEYDTREFLKYMRNYTYTVKGKEKNYASSTIHTYKAIYSKFFKSKSYRGSHRDDIVDLLKDKHKSRKENTKKIDRKNLLIEEEVYALLNAATNARDKAMVAVLYESGARRGELMSCQIKHVNFEPKKYCELTLPESKTESRTVELVMCRSFLRAWVESHPCRLPNGKPDPEAYLWISLHAIKIKEEKSGKIIGYQYTKMTNYNMYKEIQNIANRLGITKRVNPHSFRHARATKLAEYMPEQVLKQYLGWEPNSSMASIYVHDPCTKNAVLKMNNIEPEMMNN
jgi:integrase/recombinase XerD